MARRGCDGAATHGAVLGPRDPGRGRRRRRRGAGAVVAHAGHMFLVAQSSQRTQALPDEPSTVLHSEYRTGSGQVMPVSKERGSATSATQKIYEQPPASRVLSSGAL